MTEEHNPFAGMASPDNPVNPVDAPSDVAPVENISGEEEKPVEAIPTEAAPVEPSNYMQEMLTNHYIREVLTNYVKAPTCLTLDQTEKIKRVLFDIGADSRGQQIGLARIKEIVEC